MTPRKMKLLAVSLLVAALASIVIGVVYAYLSAPGEDPVRNNMEAAPDPTISIQETFTTNGNNNLVKEDVYVNVGNPGYAVYVRALIVVSWQDKSGNIYWETPKVSDYSLTLNTTDWFEEGGFYYLYYKMVDGVSGYPNTAVLIQECYQTAEPPVPGYTLHVEIVAQTIQAVGTTDVGDVPAVTDAWKIPVNPENGNLIDPNH